MPLAAGLRGHYGLPHAALEHRRPGGPHAGGPEGAGGRAEPADQVQAPERAPGAHRQEQGGRRHRLLLDLQPRGARAAGVRERRRVHGHPAPAPSCMVAPGQGKGNVAPIRPHKAHVAPGQRMQACALFCRGSCCCQLPHHPGMLAWVLCSCSSGSRGRQRGLDSCAGSASQNICLG